MQKKLIALAIAGFAAAPAFAQVTIYGVADIGIMSATDGSPNGRHVSVNSGQQYSNRFGFKVEEDLGGGLKAIVQAEHGFHMDNGNGGAAAEAQPTNTSNGSSAQTASGSRFWSRQVFAGLSSATGGTLTLGRQYNSSFDVQVKGDPYGNGTAAQFANTISAIPGGLAGRSDNSIKYQSPAFGPVSFGVTYTTGKENNVNGEALGEKNGQGYSSKVEFNMDALYVGVALNKFNGTTITAGQTDESTGSILAASYNFGAFKLFADFSSGKTESGAGAETAKARAYGIGAMVPFGAHAVTVGVSQFQNRMPAVTTGDARLIGVAYDYNLSKRTNFYAAYAKMNNEATSARGLAGAGDIYPTAVAGFDPSTIQAGIRHKF